MVGEESDDDEAEARAIVELLSKGEFTNIGPQSTAFPGHATSSIPTALPATESSETPVSQRKPSKASKFKLSLAQPQELSKPGQPSSALDTPVSTMERSSPKLTSPGPGTPIAVPTSSSRQPGRAPSASASLGPTGSPRTQPGQAQMPSMIVESPSFRPPGRAPPRVVTSSPLTKPSPMATDSPSYKSPPDSASTVVASPSSQSVVIGSQSFQSPATPTVTSSLSLPASPARQSASRADGNAFTRSEAPTAPAVVMVAEVKESSQNAQRTGAGGREKKVSRFLAERM